VGHVEILDIVDTENLLTQNMFVRNIEVNGNLFEHDFGRNNFFNNEDFLQADNVRFKYYAKDLDGETIATAYNCEELAEKLGCHVSVIKRRLAKEINRDSNTDNLFNVSRKEL
jgi:hypothetical protein